MITKIFRNAHKVNEKNKNHFRNRINKSKCKNKYKDKDSLNKNKCQEISRKK